MRRYVDALKEVDGLALTLRNVDDSFPFFCIVRVLDGRRDKLMKYLRAQGIGTGVHYVPNHIQPLFEEYRTALPVTEQIFEEIMTLPLYFEMSDADQEKVIEGVAAFFREAR
jgi:perosamine synthetase